MTICLSWQFIKILGLLIIEQHLTFWKEVFSPFEEYALRDKIYVGDNNPNIDVYEKCTIVFKQPNGISMCIEYIFYIKYVFYGHNM
jgi:hypothetical protein